MSFTKFGGLKLDETTRKKLKWLVKNGHYSDVAEAFKASINMMWKKYRNPLNLRRQQNHED